MSRRAAVTSAYFASRHARQLILAGNLRKVQPACCNTSCKEYRGLKNVIDGKATS
jgi:hypothetical protein